MGERERERKDGAEGTRVVYDSTRDQRRLCRPACAVWFIDRLDPTAAARRDPALVVQNVQFALPPVDGSRLA